MPTRRQAADTTKFRQDAFSSSAEHDRGLLWNLVAARCHKIVDREEVAMIWWLQQLSWRDGGLEQFAKDFLAVNESRVGTPSMIRFGTKRGQIYSAAQVRLIRPEICEEQVGRRFPLQGEHDVSFDDFIADTLSDRATQSTLARRARSASHPTSYPAKDFLEVCSISPEGLAEKLRRALVDPAAESLCEGLWNFPSLWDALLEWQCREIQAAGECIVETEITRTIFDELDFALHSRSFILIEGREGIGKSEGAKAWCGSKPGKAVYCRLESGSDETSFFRAIARAIGTACSYGHTSGQMRARIQDALQAGHLMLVLDEAHFLWPMNERTSRCTPRRIEWLRTALVDFGVPVALISTPQYFSRACERFLKSGWNANQIQRRLTHTVSLPDQISAHEMKVVAKRYFPAAPNNDLTRIAFVAASELGFLTVLLHLRKRVDFLAAKQPGRPEADYIAEALSVYKSNPEGHQQPPSTVPAGRLQHSCKADAPAISGRGVTTGNLSRITNEQAALIVT